MYGPYDGPLTEQLPYTIETRKGKLRGEMETTFLESANSRKKIGVSDRSADMYGTDALYSSFNATLEQQHI
jgi:hypothetical protein